MSIDDLKKRLQNESIKHKLFALEQLLGREHLDEGVMKAILALTPLENQQLNKGVAQYISLLPEQDYFKSLTTLINMKREHTSLFALRVLSESEKQPPEDFLKQLSQKVSGWNSYQQVNLFLNILEKNNVEIAEINSNLIPLLQAENFILARRAFWYLSERNLTSKENKIMLAFYDKNSGKL